MLPDSRGGRRWDIRLSACCQGIFLLALQHHHVLEPGWGSEDQYALPLKQAAIAWLISVLDHRPLAQPGGIGAAALT